MNTFLVIVIVVLAVLVVVSMVRGIIAFMQTTKIDLESGNATNLAELQQRQNKMMFNRIKYQAIAIVVVALLLLFNR